MHPLFTGHGNLINSRHKPRVLHQSSTNSFTRPPRISRRIQTIAHISIIPGVAGRRTTDTSWRKVCCTRQQNQPWFIAFLPHQTTAIKAAFLGLSVQKPRTRRFSGVRLKSSRERAAAVVWAERAVLSAVAAAVEHDGVNWNSWKADGNAAATKSHRHWAWFKKADCVHLTLVFMTTSGLLGGYNVWFRNER